MKQITILFILFFLFKLNHTYSCTGIYTKDASKVFYAMNEDWLTNKDNYDLAYKPGKNNEYDLICVINKDNYEHWTFVVNEKGLCYDTFSADDIPVTLNSDKPSMDFITFRNTALYTCSTVDQVIDLYNSHFCPWLTAGQLMFTDKYGNSAIFEGNKVIKKTKNYQICTNFYQSFQSPGYRYKIAEDALESTESYSQDFLKEILNQCSQDGSQVKTLFSIIYDANKQDLYFYRHRDFETAYKINFKEAILEAGQSEKRISFNQFFENYFTSTSNIPNNETFLAQCYPNPCINQTTISFKIEKQSNTRLVIYNSNGQLEKTILKCSLQAGMHSIPVNTSSLSTGIYYYKLITDERGITKRMIVLQD